MSALVLVAYALLAMVAAFHLWQASRASCRAALALDDLLERIDSVLERQLTINRMVLAAVHEPEPKRLSRLEECLNFGTRETRGVN